jgi:hypothetical protein
MRAPSHYASIVANKTERRSLKYIRLAAYLAGQPGEVERIELTLPEIEDVVGETLPSGARFPSWWRNDERRMHSRAWLTAGWKVGGMSEDGGRIRFIRSESA